jgi:hypothetical protein
MVHPDAESRAAEERNKSARLDIRIELVSWPLLVDARPALERLLVARKLPFQENAEQLSQCGQRFALVFGVQGDQLGRVQDDALPLVPAPNTAGTGGGLGAVIVRVLVWLGAGLRRRVLLSMRGCLMGNRPSGSP